VYEEVTRRLNECERRVLQDRIAGPRSPVNVKHTLRDAAVGLAGFAAAVLLIPGLIWLEPGPIVGGLVGGMLGLIGIVALYLVVSSIAGHRRWSSHHRDFVQNTLPELRKAFEDGRVAVKHVAASVVIEIEEYEDEGQGYLFDVGGGNVLLLKGQQYFAENQFAAGGGNPWPNTRFDIVRTLHGNCWLGIFCQGDSLEPIRTIAAEDLREEYTWDDREEVRRGTLDEVARAICRPTVAPIVSRT